MIELAVVMPVLLLLVAGIIDFGLVLYADISLRQGTSAGAREAAVTTEPPGTWNCPTTPSNISGDAKDLICFIKSRVGLPPANTRVSIWFQTPYTTNQPVVICTQYPSSSATGLLSPTLDPITLQSKVEIRIEQSSTTFASPVQETPLSSGGWPASCDQP